MSGKGTINDSSTLFDVVERVLDKGLAVNADISVSVAGTELLGIRIRAALASFETAAKYGLEFPAGVNQGLAAWQEAMEPRENCPGCGKRQKIAKLLQEGCPWCGWVSVRAQLEQKAG